jgi:SAM-dependent methyltransferase
MPGQLIDRLCPVCGGHSSAVLFLKKTLRLVHCLECSMVYASPVEDIFVNGEFYDGIATPFYLSADKLDSDYSPVRFARELRIFRGFCPGGSVLDVGCSTGGFLYQLGRQFGGDYKCLGIDVAGQALDYAESKGVRVLRDRFLSADLPTDSFSAVTFWAVVEHLNQPRDFLLKAHSILKPSGLCFILVPNFDSLAVRLLKSKYRYIFPQHLNYFTIRSLRLLVETVPGFRMIYSGSTHFNPFVIWQDFKGAGDFVPDEERAKLLKKTTRYKNNWLLQPVKAGLGAFERLLGSVRLADNLVIVVQKG